MTPWSAKRLLLTLLASAGLWAVLAGACLLVGPTGTFGMLTRDNYPIRREAVLMASLVGAALASAGVTYQAVLRNPLADPYLLGVSSGASLFAYMWQFPWITGLLFFVTTLTGRALSQQLFTFIGAAISIGVVFLLASRRGRLEPITLLLVGVIVNAINGSIYLLIDAIARQLPASGGSLVFLVGGIQRNLATHHMVASSAVIAIAWLALLYLAGQLNVASLSEAEAESLGVHIHRLRWIALIVASLITASAVAVSGPIGFIGLVCPHLARLMVGNDTRKLLPLATALGAGLLAVADAISRLLTTQASLPVGVLTGLLGGPFFLLLLYQSRKRAVGGATP